MQTASINTQHVAERPPEPYRPENLHQKTFSNPTAHSNNQTAHTPVYGISLAFLQEGCIQRAVTHAAALQPVLRA
jgi:hypothetical protein